MESSPTIAALAEALSKAQGAIRHAEKDRVNPHFNRRYATLASVWDAARGPLTDNGFAVVQPISVEGATVVVRTVLMHKTGEWIESTLAMQGATGNPQALGGIISYARRYAFSALIGICADEDNDGNDSHTPTPKAPTHAPPSPVQQKAPQSPAAKDAGGSAVPAPAAEREAPRILTDAQRWNVAVATIRRKLGQVSGDKMIAEITDKYATPGTSKVPDDKRPQLIAELEKAARGDATPTPKPET